MSETKKMTEESKTVHMVSQEGESFEVPVAVANLSVLVKTMIDEDHDDKEAQEIPLPNVKSSILAKAVQHRGRLHARRGSISARWRKLNAGGLSGSLLVTRSV
jgi:hypothetical protein